MSSNDINLYILNHSNSAVVTLPLDKIIIYQLTQYEIDILERGKDTTYLSFSIGLISSAFSLFIVLLVESIDNPFIQTGIVILTIIFTLASIFLLIQHNKQKDSFDKVIEKIKRKRQEYIEQIDTENINRFSELLL